MKGNKTIYVSIRLSSKPEDLLIRKYIDYRIKSGNTGNDYLQGLLPFYVRRENPPIIAKIYNDGYTDAQYIVRRFSIKPSCPCYDVLSKCTKSLQSLSIHNVLKQCIVPVESKAEEWYMPESELLSLMFETQLGLHEEEKTEDGIKNSFSDSSSITEKTIENIEEKEQRGRMSFGLDGYD